MKMTHKKRESVAYVASLSLAMDQTGQLIYLEGKECPIGSLKEMLEQYPDWEPAQATIEAVRWIQEQLEDVKHRTKERFADHESIRIQERPLYAAPYRSEEELGDDQDVPEGE